MKKLYGNLGLLPAAYSTDRCEGKIKTPGSRKSRPCRKFLKRRMLDTKKNVKLCYECFRTAESSRRATKLTGSRQFAATATQQ